MTDHLTLTRCPLCGERERLAIFEKAGWHVVRCANCSLVYVDARFDRADMDAFYGQDYYEGGVRGLHRPTAAPRGERRGRVQWLARLVPGGTLLDVGCAAGFFLSAAAERYKVAGVEVSDYAAEYARQHLGLPRLHRGDDRRVAR